VKTENVAAYIKKFSPFVNKNEEPHKLQTNNQKISGKFQIYENAVRDKWKPWSLSISMPFSSAIQKAPVSDQLLAVLRSMVVVFVLLCC